MSTLAHKRVLVTRALEQNAKLIAKLESKQAIALAYPCLEITFLPFKIPEAQYDWVVYTSQNAVKAFSGYPVPAKNTATLTHDSKSLAESFKNRSPQKILLPQGDLADDSLKNALIQQGHEVTRLVVYSTRKPAHPAEFNFDKLDAITFTSPSAIKYFLELGGRADEVLIACIGTTTYQAAAQLGFTHIICAKEHSLDGLIQILEDYFACSNVQHA